MDNIKEKLIDTLRYADGAVCVLAGMPIKQQAEYIYEQIADIQMKLGVTMSRTGRWEILGEEFANCSYCGTIFEALPTPFSFKCNNKFCRSCGAHMILED